MTKTIVTQDVGTNRQEKPPLKSSTIDITTQLDCSQGTGEFSRLIASIVAA